MMLATISMLQYDKDAMVALRCRALKSIFINWISPGLLPNLTRSQASTVALMSELSATVQSAQLVDALL